jgi:hypothetical protein
MKQEICAQPAGSPLGMHRTTMSWGRVPTLVMVRMTVLLFCTVMFSSVEPLSTPPTVKAVSLALTSFVVVPPETLSLSPGVHELLPPVSFPLLLQLTAASAMLVRAKK